VVIGQNNHLHSYTTYKRRFSNRKLQPARKQKNKGIKPWTFVAWLQRYAMSAFVRNVKIIQQPITPVFAQTADPLATSASRAAADHRQQLNCGCFVCSGNTVATVNRAGRQVRAAEKREVRDERFEVEY